MAKKDRMGARVKRDQKNHSKCGNGILSDCYRYGGNRAALF